MNSPRTDLTPPPSVPGEVEAWGRVRAPAAERFSEDLRRDSAEATLSRGLGRSYGDSSFPPRSAPVVLNTTLADRILDWDPASGRLRAEAGLSLHAMNRALLRRGWFTPVTPGTQFVTAGGMVASDVHGKNHHVAGCIGEHLRSLTLRVADGRVVTCSPEEHADLFLATIGGMGLTGHILEVELDLEAVPSPWIWQESERIPDIDTYIEALKTSAASWPMTVGWIDCIRRGRGMGRGILMKGRWATAEEARDRTLRWKPALPMPDVFPSWLLNPLTITAFNTLYYWKHLPRRAEGLVHPETFFYPLDAIRNWNRMYGRRGFTQYQCVLPTEGGGNPARAFLELLTREGGASFLCVIKDCGPEGRGLLSFPRPGISIALDIPIRSGTQELIDTLNRHVIEAGGRIYLTKDTFTRPEHFRAMEPRLDAFLEVRRRWDPDLRIRSAQSVRMFGDPA